MYLHSCVFVVEFPRCWDPMYQLPILRVIITVADVDYKEINDHVMRTIGRSIKIDMVSKIPNTYTPLFYISATTNMLSNMLLYCTCLC